jgi:hypothetical protein
LLAALTALSMAARSPRSVACTASSFPNAPISRWRPIVPSTIIGSMPSSRKVAADSSISAARRSP